MESNAANQSIKLFWLVEWAEWMEWLSSAGPSIKFKEFELTGNWLYVLFPSCSPFHLTHSLFSLSLLKKFLLSSCLIDWLMSESKGRVDLIKERVKLNGRREKREGEGSKPITNYRGKWKEIEFLFIRAGEPRQLFSPFHSTTTINSPTQPN